MNCCLGVLCRVAGVRGSKPNVDGEREFDGNPSVLSTKLARRFKISVDEQDMLTGMNDGDFDGNGKRVKRRRFAGIATWIEKNL